MFNSTKLCSKPVFVLLLVLLLAATGLGTVSAHDSPAVQHPTQFTDVHSHSFYATAVDWMVQNEITTGTSLTTFHPERNVTRGEAAAFLWRMSCRPEPAASHSFSDVHADWQQQPVGWLQQHGAAPVQGTVTEPASVFNPSTLLTRAQIAGLLHQLFGDGAQPETVSPFVDVTEPWQTAPVLWLLANQITTGTSDTTFDPDRNVTRGEFATFLWRHSQQPDPTQRICQPPPCGAGLVKLDEFVTETDNGCRAANCYGIGRNTLTGECLTYAEWLDTLVRDCPTVDTSDGLGMYGGDFFISQGPGNPIIRTEPADPEFPQMVPGSSWVAHIQLVDNDNWDWWEGGLEPVELSHYFGVGVSAGRWVPRVGEEQKAGSTIFTTKEPEGSWTASFTIPQSHPPQHVFGSGATARGAGCWAVRFERIS